MYKNTDRQASLLDVTSTMGESARRRLKSSSAHAFVPDVYPILLEGETKFAHLYGTTGQPNRSVARLLGVCILQENQDLTDQQAVDALTFDARWRYALGFEADEDSYVSRQELVEFRSRIARHDPESELLTEIFHQLTDEALAALGLSTSRQRVDSSLIQSNIRSRGRVDLLLSTLRQAIHTVRKANVEATDRLSRAPAGQVPLDHRERSRENGEGRFLHAFFDANVCDVCEHQDRCPVRRKGKQAFLPLVPRLLARDQRRRQQLEATWWEAYAIGSGIEATFSELKRTHGCRKLRVRRRPPVKMALVFKLMACNVKRWTRASRVA